MAILKDTTVNGTLTTTGQIQTASSIDATGNIHTDGGITGASASVSTLNVTASVTAGNASAEFGDTKVKKLESSTFTANGLVKCNNGATINPISGTLTALEVNGNASISDNLQVKSLAYSGNPTLFEFGLLNLIYPVGAIYLTTTTQKNPQSFLGGTWSRIPGNYLLRASDAVGAPATMPVTGGSEKIGVDHLPEHTHYEAQREASGTAYEAGSHTHSFKIPTYAHNANSDRVRSANTNDGAPGYSGDTNPAGAHTHGVSVTVPAHYTGGNGTQYRNYFPPYVDVVAWVRIA